MKDGILELIPKTGAALIVAGLIVAGSVASMFWAGENLQQAIRWVIHTHQVIEQSQSALSAVQNMELRLRTYAITRLRQQYDAYQNDREQFRQAIAAVKSLTADNNEQQKKVDEFHLVVQSIDQDAERIFATTAPIAQAKAITLFEKHRQLLNQVRQIARATVDNEQVLLAKREVLWKSAQQKFFVLIALLALSVTGLFVYLYQFIRRQIIAEQKTFAQLETFNAALRDANAAQESAQLALRDALNEASLNEHEARLANIRLSAILYGVGEGVYQVDKTGRLTYMNPACEDMLGYKTEDVRGESMHELVHYQNEQGEPRSSEQCPLLAVIRGGSIFQSTDDVFFRKDGQMINVAYFSSPLVLNDEIQGAVVTFRDITERKKADQRLREFYQTLSHELRTPLASISGTLSMLDDGMLGALPEPALQLVSASRGECERLTRLINDILDISKIEAGALEVHLDVHSPRKLIERVLKTQALAATNKSITLSSQVGETADVICDADRTCQILVNLISNAIKFSPTGGSVDVGTRSDGAAVVFFVRDSGPGIPKDDIYKLFRRFEQLDVPAVAKQAGTGLGLAISKALVERQNGLIGLESEEGAGATFWFQLPAVKEDGRGEDTVS